MSAEAREGEGGDSQTTPRQEPHNATTTAPAAPAAPTPPWADDDDPIPENIDDFRNALARRIAAFIGNRSRAWRDCPQPSCRRARECRPRRIRCRNAPEHPPSTPEEQARAIAIRAMRQHLGEGEER